MATTTQGVWRLQDVRDALLNGQWKTYSGTLGDPGQLWAWGDNRSGQLGDNSITQRNSPIQIPGVDWCYIGCSGEFFSFGIKADGTLWSWGNNASGQLGDNSTTNRSSPVQVPGTTWLYVDGAGAATAGLKTDGTLWTWGSNSVGTLGNNSTIDRASPVQVPGTWTFVLGGTGQMIGLKSNGTMWSWGENHRGQLGHGSLIHRSSPTQIPGTSWCAISAGGPDSHSHAIRTDGTLWGMGLNFYGTLGNNTAGSAAYQSSPTQIPGTTWCCVFTAGSSTIALKTNNTLWSWGYGNEGQLGINTGSIGSHKSSPSQIPGTTWINIYDGAYHKLAGKSDRTFWTWGSGLSGELGNNSTTNRSSPIQIPGTTWSVMGGSRGFSLGIKWI